MQNMRHYSNTMREKTYRRTEIPEEYGPLNHLISVDREKKTARVGSRMRMDQLVDALLPYGLQPKVVPEFKGITVGGAVSGAAIESSSCQQGQFNDGCISYRVLTGKGEMTVSPEENSDLFYGISGSYGSLGTLLEAELSLVRTRGFMQVSYYTFNDLFKALEFMRETKNRAVEGMLFGKNRIVVVAAEDISPEETKQLPLYSLQGYGSEWFYSHAERISKEKRDAYSEAMAVKDYFFRHDRGAFWMAGLSLNPSILWKFWKHKLHSLFELQEKDGSLPHALPKNPGPFFRHCFGWFLDSQLLYSSLHSGSERWFERHLSIQDYYIPWQHAGAFISFVQEKIGIAPLWLCPVKPTSTPQYFSPHYHPEASLLLNVGVYGIPFEGGGKKAVEQMESLTHRLGGRKMLYCQTYLSPSEFWTIYPKTLYNQLREKYGAEQLHAGFDEKVLSR